MYLNPRYRSKAAAYDFDKYSSKGSAVHPVKKLNIHNQILEAYEQAPPAITSAGEGNLLTALLIMTLPYTIHIAGNCGT